MGAKRVLYCHECGAPAYRIKDWVTDAYLRPGDLVTPKMFLNLDYTSIEPLTDIHCPQCGYVVALRSENVR